MSEPLCNSKDPTERVETTPDYFRYYIHEIQGLFSQKDDFLSLSAQHSDKVGTNSYASICKEANALFSDGMGDGLSDFKRERLKTSLKQSVTVLSQEVDDMLDPVLSMYRIKSHLKNKEHGDVSHSPCKKQKLSSSPSTTTPTCAAFVGAQPSAEGSGSEDMDGNCPDTVGSEESHFNDLKKSCSNCKSTKTQRWRNGPGGPESLCNSCGHKYEKRTAAAETDEVEKNREVITVNEDLLTLLENAGPQAKTAVNKYSEELSTKLDRMEQQLEELLDIVVSKCRQMNLAEKQQLKKLIRNLPPKNLDRVVQIIRRRKLPNGGQPWDEINIDLEKEDNVTLWRLYYYVEAVESAKRLSS